MAGPQQHRAVGRKARQVDDGRFDPDFALAAVQHGGDARIRAEFVAHVLGGGRADVAELVGRRRRDAALPALEGLQQADRHRMRGAADADRVLAAGDGVGNVRRTLQDHGQRAGPEGVGQPARFGWNLARTSNRAEAPGATCTITG
jgi:hypothetical protein